MYDPRELRRAHSRGNEAFGMRTHQTSRDENEKNMFANMHMTPAISDLRLGVSASKGWLKKKRNKPPQIPPHLWSGVKRHALRSDTTFSRYGQVVSKITSRETYFNLRF
jgi:hypothetical protein